MLLILRIVLSVWFVILLAGMSQEDHRSVAADLDSAYTLALAIVVGLGASLTWAPVLGNQIASPVSDLLTNGTVAKYRDGLMQWIRWSEARGKRRLTLFLCFWEGILHPDLPGHFVIGLQNSRPGSWLEKVFAREVYRFSNVRHCVNAYNILRLRHDLDPGEHPVAEVELALASQFRDEKPEIPPLNLGQHAPIGLPPRNQRIQLSSKLESTGAQARTSAPASAASSDAPQVEPQQ